MQSAVIKNKMSNIQFLISKKNKRQRGFTLIELLVVMTIMGILTVISVTSFRGAQVKSRDARRKSDLDSMSKSVNMYFSDNGVFPSSLPNGGEFKTGSGNSEVIYMKEVPVEVTNNVKPYTYVVSGTKKSFKIFANLENEEDGSCVISCPGYTVTNGCCYGINSSNISIGGSMI